jgi:hypothetical protein
MGTTMKLGRRALLKATVGASQLALLDKLARAPRARAQGRQGPTKLLTIFMPGGWMSSYAFCGLRNDQVATVIPSVRLENGARLADVDEPVLFDASELINLDGSQGEGGHGTPLRMPRLWNQAALEAGGRDPRGGTSSSGWSWMQHRLWENTVALHGVDQMTVAHQAGSVSSMCGVAASEFRAPAMQAIAAAGLMSRFPDRPLPSVWVGGLQPQALTLPAEANSHRVSSLYDAQMLFSRGRGRAWNDLRPSEVSSPTPASWYDGSAVPGTLLLTPIEERALRRTRSLRGLLTSSSEPVLQQLHDGMVGVSKVLAREVTDVLQQTNGAEYTPIPTWARDGATNRFALDVGGKWQDDGSTWSDRFDLTLRLLKSDVCTSVAMDCPGPNYLNFDTHAEGHYHQFAAVRATQEILGRFLGEMKATPGANGGTLLDDTLVMIISDFARTWPGSVRTSDHWAANTAIMVGGGIRGNQTLGGYTTEGQPIDSVGYDGIPMQLQESTGVVTRRPRSSDVIHTAMSILGVEDFRIPGGSGEVLGIRNT